MNLRNVGMLQQDYTAIYPRKLSSCQLIQYWSTDFKGITQRSICAKLCTPKITLHNNKIKLTLKIILKAR
jgi:hypothetical protein